MHNRLSVSICKSQTFEIFWNAFKKKTYFDHQTFMTPHPGLSHICCPSQNGLVPVASLGVENQAFEKEQVPELDEGASQPDSEVKVQVDWTSELPVSVSVPTVHIHSLVVDFSSVSFLDVVAAKSLKLVCLMLYLYCSLLSHCSNAIMHLHNMIVTFMSLQTCMTFCLPQNTR